MLIFTVFNHCLYKQFDSSNEYRYALKLIETMVIILDGNSKIGAHLRTISII